MVSIIATSAAAVLVSLVCCACCARRGGGGCGPLHWAWALRGGGGAGAADGAPPGAAAPRHCPTPVRALLPIKPYAPAAPGAALPDAAPDRCGLCLEAFEGGQAVT
jgi:hypothetical protein